MEDNLKSEGKPKLVGITCDNYKVDKFKRDLTDAGFTNFIVVPFKKDVSLIKVTCLESDYAAVGKICQAVENHFGAMKN